MTLNLTTTFIYKRTVQLWAQEWHLQVLIYLWGTLNIQPYRIPHTNHRFGGDSMTNFRIWTYGQDKHDEFINNFNSPHDSIKFTFDTSPHSVHFLDGTLTLTDNIISTDLCINPPDTHQYLLNTYCHLKHTKTSIPYSLALRLDTIQFSLETVSSVYSLLTKHSPNALMN